MEVEAAVVVEMEPKGKSHKHWVKEIKAAQKRFRKFQKQGTKVIGRYLDEETDHQYGGGNDRLNLFHKNVSTLTSMMSGQVPKIDVAREHYDPDLPALIAGRRRAVWGGLYSDVETTPARPSPARFGRCQTPLRVRSRDGDKYRPPDNGGD